RIGAVRVEAQHGIGRAFLVRSRVIERERQLEGVVHHPEQLAAKVVLVLAACTIEGLVSGLKELLGPVRDELLEAREADAALITLAVLRREGDRAEQLPLD